MEPVLFLPYAGFCLLLWSLLASRKLQRGQKEKVAALSITLLVCYCYYVVLGFSTDIAFKDDYDILDSFDRLLYSDSATDWLKALMSQVNEHRFVFERLLISVIYLFTGTASPKLQIVIGNLFLIGIVILLYKFFKTTRLPLYYFLPVVLVIFSLLYYENMYWAIAAIQNTPVLFFTMLSSWSLARYNRRGTAIALLAAIAATLTSGSGMAVWIIGTALLVFQKRYRVLLGWLMVATLLLTFYFTFDYSLSPRDRSGLLSHPFTNFRAFLVFLGSLFSEGFEYGEKKLYHLRTLVAALAGGVIFIVASGWLINFTRNSTRKTLPPATMITGLLLFVMATGAMLVVSRPFQTTHLIAHHMISSRYLIFSVSAWAGIYLVLLYLFKKSAQLSRATFLVFFVVNASLNFVSYYSFIPVLANHKATLELDKLYIDEHNYMLMSFGEQYADRMFWNHPTAFANLVERLKEHGLYNPEIQPEEHLLSAIREKNNHIPPTEWILTKRTTQTTGFANRPLEVNHFKITHPGCPEFQPRFFLLRSDSDQFVLPAVPSRAQPSSWLKRPSFWACEYESDFYTTKFPEGNYQVYIVSENKGDAVRIEALPDQLTLSYDF